MVTVRTFNLDNWGQYKSQLLVAPGRGKIGTSPPPQQMGFDTFVFLCIYKWLCSPRQKVMTSVFCMSAQNDSAPPPPQAKNPGSVPENGHLAPITRLNQGKSSIILFKTKRGSLNYFL